MMKLSLLSGTTCEVLLASGGCWAVGPVATWYLCRMMLWLM